MRSITISTLSDRIQSYLEAVNKTMDAIAVSLSDNGG